jgi:hypothetical protein
MGTLWFEASLNKKLVRPYLKEEARHGRALCNPRYEGDGVRSISL